MDVASEILNQIPIKGRMVGVFSMHEEWALRSPKEGDPVFHLISKGSAVIKTDRDEIELGEGDMIMFPNGKFHTIGSSANATILDLSDETLVSCVHSKNGDQVYEMVKKGVGPETVVVCAALDLGPITRSPLLRSFPDHIVIRKPAFKSASSVDQLLLALVGEAMEGSPGVFASLDSVLHVVFVFFLRKLIDEAPDDQFGWLKGLRNREIAGSLTLIHSSPERAWTVENLAKEIGQSRSKFSREFSELIGEPPIQYLNRLRMTQAAQQLLSMPEKSIVDVALSVGYQYEASFSAAFKREYGVPPGSWRQKNFKGAA